MEIEEILGKYDLGQVLEVKSCPGGTANQNYKIIAEQGAYFLKWRALRHSNLDDLQFDHAFLRYLKSQGLPFHEPAAPKGSKGDGFVIADGRLFDLTPFVEGNSFRGTEEEITESASVLARMHQALINFVPPSSGKQRPAYESRDQIEHSLKLAEPVFSRPELKMVKEAFLETFRFLQKEYYPELEPILDRCIIHGDYHAGNMLFGADGRICGIFDLDAASKQIRIRDLVDGVLFFARENPADRAGEDIISLTRPFVFDLSAMRFFIETYNKLYPLSSEEKMAIPLMLRQRWLGIKLDPIRYGKVDTEGAVMLLKEADRPFRWLDEHASEMRSFLQAIPNGRDFSPSPSLSPQGRG